MSKSAISSSQDISWEGQTQALPSGVTLMSVVVFRYVDYTKVSIATLYNLPECLSKFYGVCLIIKREL